MSIYSRIIDLQKLGQAWDKAMKNKPAAGTDHVTWEMFDSDRNLNLKQLNLELSEHRYMPLPVKVVSLYREEKVREVSLFAMRDKTVQQAIASELVKMYDPLLSGACCAYRPDKSALNAINRISEYISESGHQEGYYYVKTDIHHFFDEIDVNRLTAILGQKIPEPDVITLIKDQCLAPVLNDDGEVEAVSRGIHQGAAMTPVLSNIYMMQIDCTMEKAAKLYIRYSDDILILSDSQKEAEEMLEKIRIQTESLGLALNDKKTAIGTVKSGFEFLGYHFDADGKAIAAKAEDNLAERLEGMWLTEKTLTVKDKLAKGSEILNGWEQYFRGERTPGSFYEYAVVAYMTRYKASDKKPEFISMRSQYHNDNRQLAEWMAQMWEETGKSDLTLYEYEDYYGVAQKDQDKSIPDESRKELTGIYAELVRNETEESLTELMQCYTDLGAFNKGAEFSDRIHQFQQCAENRKRPVLRFEPDLQQAITIDLSANAINEYMKLFAGREDTYTIENFRAGNGRKTEQVPDPLTEEVIHRHLRGEITAGTYVQRSNSTVKYLVIDIDISKRILLLNGNQADEMKAYLQKAAELTGKYQAELMHMGFSAYPEESGYRGFHLWLFFDEWIPVRYVHLLEDMLDQKIPVDEDISVEYFPNKAHLKNGKMGQSIKLPYGIHARTGKRSRMLNDDFKPINDPEAFCRDAAKFSITAVKRVIGTMEDIKQVQNNTLLDRDITAFGALSDNVKTVLEGCNIMLYLCQKARKTGYLTHFERLSILYVFGHMGEEGQDFVHIVMKFTLNYQYHTTQYFISRLQAKPISCNKLREQYAKVSAEIGCNCNFKRTRNCYPSPVMHALQLSTDETSTVTIPTSRMLTKENEQKVHDELNVNQQVTEITKKILDLKKQKRGIDKNISKCERELERIFDESQIDCLEVEYGMLVRRKREDGYEWIVEI